MAYLFSLHLKPEDLRSLLGTVVVNMRKIKRYTVTDSTKRLCLAISTQETRGNARSSAESSVKSTMPCKKTSMPVGIITDTRDPDRKVLAIHDRVGPRESSRRPWA